MVNCVEKYRLYRFAAVRPEWLCMAFSKNEMQNLENTEPKRKAPLRVLWFMN